MFSVLLVCNTVNSQSQFNDSSQNLSLEGFGVKNYHDIQLDSLFENPSVFKIAWYFLQIGGFAPVFIFLFFSCLLIRLNNIKEKISVQKENTNKERDSFAKNPMGWKNFEIYKNFKYILKMVFSRNIHKMPQEELILSPQKMIGFSVRVNLISLLLICTVILMLIACRIALSFNAQLFRERFFEEFLDKVQISHFSNPNECLGFLNGVLGSIENFYSYLFSALGVFIAFLVKFTENLH